MQMPTANFNEASRLAALKAYDILDTTPEQEFDEITRLASQICQTPVALITLLDKDRQWFKSTVGTEVKETPRKIAFCEHTIAEPGRSMVINDLRADTRFMQNPLVTNDPNVVFYAGVSLVTEEGHPLGTLCVLDVKPNELSAEQLFSLEVLARQVMSQIELRKKIREMERVNESLAEVNAFVQKFASAAAHDIRNPLTNIRISSQLLQKHLKSTSDEKGLKMVEMNLAASENLLNILEEMLEYSKNPARLLDNLEHILLDELVLRLKGMIHIPENVAIEIAGPSCAIFSSRVALEQIFLNLLTNAIRYSDKDKSHVSISVKETKSHYIFRVKDNGIGIAAEHAEKIFEKSFTLNQPDRFQQKGNGIGLSTVKTLVGKLKGTINVESEPGYGSCFIFSIKKMPLEN